MLSLNDPNVGENQFEGGKSVMANYQEEDVVVNLKEKEVINPEERRKKTFDECYFGEL